MLTIKNVDGIIPISVDQKKLEILTLKRQGNTFAIAKGIPPTNLYTKRKINSDVMKCDIFHWLKNDTDWPEVARRIV